MPAHCCVKITRIPRRRRPGARPARSAGLGLRTCSTGSIAGMALAASGAHRSCRSEILCPLSDTWISRPRSTPACAIGRRPDVQEEIGQLITARPIRSAALQALSVRRGDRVAYIAPNTHAHLEGYYAVPQVGAVLIPINYRLIP